jgi:hypothetical protein
MGRGKQQKVQDEGAAGGEKKRFTTKHTKVTKEREGFNGDRKESCKPRRAPRTRRNIEKIKLAGFGGFGLGVWEKKVNHRGHRVAQR